jgi:hypothetical protein
VCEPHVSHLTSAIAALAVAISSNDQTRRRIKNQPAITVTDAIIVVAAELEHIQ